MSKRKIEMFEYKSVIRCLREGYSARQIAKEKLIGRHKANKIKQVAKQQGWLDQDTPLPDETELVKIFKTGIIATTESKAGEHHEFIKKCVGDEISAKVIHRHLVENHDFPFGYSSIVRYVKRIKKTDLSHLTAPLTFLIGEAAQVDFGQGPKLYDERSKQVVKTWFFVMTLCWSRHQYVEIVTDQSVETWLRCHQNAFTWFGGVVKKVIIDNVKCAITKASYYTPEVQRSYEAFAQEYGFIISACPPYDPQKKGQVESGVNYVKCNFLPLREIRSVQDGNNQLKLWILTEAGLRCHGSTFKKPLEQFNQHEKEALKALPTVLAEIVTWHIVKSNRNCHVRYHYCDYSVPYDLYGKLLWLKAGPTLIFIYDEQYQCVATHPRLFGKGDKSTTLAHLPPHANYYLTRTPEWCLEHAQRVGENCYLLIDDLIHHTTQDLLRQAQAILALADKFGSEFLEQACQHAINFHVFDYKTIKYMLEKGFNATLTSSVPSDELQRKIYQGGARFQRQPTDFIN